MIEIFESRDKIYESLIEAGYQVIDFHVTPADFKDTVQFKLKLQDLKVDCIFNLFEGFSDAAWKEAEFVELIEETRIPFTGNPSKVLRRCLDKNLTKKMLAEANIPAPLGEAINKTSDIERIVASILEYPLFVKPQFEDGSVGIDDHSKIKNPKELKEILTSKLQKFPSGIIVEKYLSGTEYSVSLFGEYPFEFMGLIEIFYDKSLEENAFMTFGSKWEPTDEVYKKSSAIYNPKIEKTLSEQLVHISQEAGKTLGCRGYFTVDLRLDENKKPYILEVNPNPDIHPAWGFMKSSSLMGYTYQQMVFKLLDFALNTGGSSQNPLKQPLTHPQNDRPVHTIPIPFDIDTYCSLAQRTGAFHEEEIPILKELLTYYQQDPGKDYYVFQISENGRIQGFALFGPTPLTQFAWDIYWIVVDPQFQNKGIGSRLIKMIEEFIEGFQPKFVFRIETSGKSDYLLTRKFYLKLGFQECGRIPDFYANNDDLLLFFKSHE